ncbi:hypothetical protein ACFQDZ_08275 [Sulfitobacter pacificus]|uniref:hypothetical protein n=1 Tax=Sulfitobacter pacificus TaxID=1499314 RepID=UPI0036207585
MTKTTNKYSPEVRERAVRMVLDGVGQQRDWPLDGSFGPSPAEPVRSTDLMLRFYNGRFEPDPAIVILCCVRSQREKCGMSEKIRAAAQRINRPFVGVAAYIRRRTHSLRDKAGFGVWGLC